MDNQKWWMTSEGSGAMSLRVKSVLTTLLSIIVPILNMTGHPIAGDDLMAFINQVVLLVSLVGTVVSPFMFIIGFARNQTNKANNLGKYAPKD